MGRAFWFQSNSQLSNLWWMPHSEKFHNRIFSIKYRFNLFESSLVRNWWLYIFELDYCLFKFSRWLLEGNSFLWLKEIEKNCEQSSHMTQTCKRNCKVSELRRLWIIRWEWILKESMRSKAVTDWFLPPLQKGILCSGGNSTRISLLSPAQHLLDTFEIQADSVWVPCGLSAEKDKRLTLWSNAAYMWRWWDGRSGQ